MSEMERVFGKDKEQLFSVFHRKGESYEEFKKRVMTPPDDFETELLPKGRTAYSVRNRVSLQIF